MNTDWPKVRACAKPELSKLARSLLEISRLFADGKITRLEARSLLDIHRNTTKIVFLTVEGLGLLAVEKAIGAVREAVNGTLGFALL